MEVWEKVDKEVVEEVLKAVDDVWAAAGGKGKRAGRAHGFGPFFRGGNSTNPVNKKHSSSVCLFSLFWLSLPVAVVARGPQYF